MKRRILKMLLIAMLAGITPGVRAEVDDGAAVDPALVASLMAWVEAHTGTKVQSLPRVVASHSQFRAVLRGMGGGFAGRPQSAYIAGNVYLDSNSWDPTESSQLSLLVHELVHHAQRSMVNAHWACPDAREAQAYNLQNQWLEENGHSPFVRASWIERVSSCPNSNSGTYLAQRPEN